MDNWRDAKTDPPDEADLYIVTLANPYGNRYSDIGYYDSGWEVDDDIEPDVLYWMPFPEPKED